MKFPGQEEPENCWLTPATSKDSYSALRTLRIGTSLLCLATAHAADLSDDAIYELLLRQSLVSATPNQALSNPFIRAFPKVIRGHETEEEQAYYMTSAEPRFTYGLTYIALAEFLAIMCHELSLELPRAIVRRSAVSRASLGANRDD